MGLIDKLRAQYEIRKISKYTERRANQSHFEFHDRAYYDNVYRDGVYVHPEGRPRYSSSSNSSSSSNLPWVATLSGMIRRSSQGSAHSGSLAASQMKTSETYTASAR